MNSLCTFALSWLTAADCSTRSSNRMRFPCTKHSYVHHVWSSYYSQAMSYLLVCPPQDPESRHLRHFKVRQCGHHIKAWESSGDQCNQQALSWSRPAGQHGMTTSYRPANRCLMYCSRLSISSLVWAVSFQGQPRKFHCNEWDCRSKIKKCCLCNSRSSHPHDLLTSVQGYVH